MGVCQGQKRMVSMARALLIPYPSSWPQTAFLDPLRLMPAKILIQVQVALILVTGGLLSGKEQMCPLQDAYSSGIAA